MRPTCWQQRSQWLLPLMRPQVDEALQGTLSSVVPSAAGLQTQREVAALAAGRGTASAAAAAEAAAAALLEARLAALILIRRGLTLLRSAFKCLNSESRAQRSVCTPLPADNGTDHKADQARTFGTSE